MGLVPTGDGCACRGSLSGERPAHETGMAQPILRDRFCCCGKSLVKHLKNPSFCLSIPVYIITYKEQVNWNLSVIWQRSDGMWWSCLCRSVVHVQNPELHIIMIQLSRRQILVHLFKVLIQRSSQTREGRINTTQLETQYLRDQRPSLIFGIWLLDNTLK